MLQLNASSDFDSEAPTHPDATSIYDIRPRPRAVAPRTRKRSAASNRRLISVALQDIAGLRAAIAMGWDVAPELAYEERRLAALVAADRR